MPDMRRIARDELSKAEERVATIDVAMRAGYGYKGYEHLEAAREQAMKHLRVARSLSDSLKVTADGRP